MAERNEKHEHKILIQFYAGQMAGLSLSSGDRDFMELSELIGFHVTELVKISLREKAHNA